MQVRCSTVAPRAPYRRIGAIARSGSARLLKLHAASSTVTAPPKPVTITPPVQQVPLSLEWQAIGDLAGFDVLNGFTLRSGQVPSTAPTLTLPTEPDVTSTAPVLLYRDTNAWCPFCERVWLALEQKQIQYDSVLIDLRNKPDWYKAMVPTTLVPAARINGTLVYESKDILLKLEEEFPERPLLPSEPGACEGAMEMFEGADAVSKAGYAFMAGRRIGPATETPQEAKPIEAYQADFETQLAKMEAQLSMSEGPFMLGSELSLVDIMYVPAMERMAANLPVFRNFELRNNSSLPHVARWFAALEQLPSFQKVCSDDGTLNLLMRRVFSVSRSPAADAVVDDARREAAAKIAANHERIIADILANGGFVHGTGSEYGVTAPSLFGRPAAPTRAIVAAVDYSMRRLCSQLLTGSSGPRHEDREAAAIGAATIAFFHNRASSPRDMSAAAASALRAACKEVMLDMY